MTRILPILLTLALLSPLASAADAPKVLIAPFTEISEGPQRAWIARAFQQALVAELSRLPLVTPVRPESGASGIDDPKTAAEAARAVDAAFAVYGAYQLVEQELRVTGQVLDVASGDAIGGIKATGNLRDLFGIEDIVAAQVKRALTAKLDPSTTQPADTLAERTIVEPSGPVRLGDRDSGFRGSDLEQSLQSNGPYVYAGQPFEDERQRYRYGTPYTPYGWSPYSYGYGPRYPYGYVPRYRYGYGYVYDRPYIVVPRVHIHHRPTVRIQVPVVPSRSVPNGNHNRGPGNTMQGGPGNTMQGGSGNTVR